MKFPLPRFVPHALAALLLAVPASRSAGDNAAAASPGADGADDSPLMQENHEVDAKVKEVLKNAKSPEEAVHDLRAMVIKEPDNAELWFDVGEACYATHDYEKAISAYKRCLALDPKRKGLWQIVGRLYFWAGDYAASLDAFKSGLAADPEDVSAMNSYAIALVIMGKLDIAESILDQAKGMDPSYAPLWITTGMLQNKRKHWPEALDAYNKAVSLDPNDTTAMFARGLTKMLMGDRDGGIADFQKLTVKAPTYTGSWLALMQAYKDAGKTDEVIKTGEAAVAANPGKAQLWQALGEGYVDAKDGNKAIEAFEKAKTLVPGLKYLDANFAAAQMLGGDSAKSEDALKQAIEENPRDGYSQANLGRLYLKQGKLMEAVGCLEKAVDLLPDNAAVRVSLGMAYVFANKYDEAASQLGKAAALGDKSATLSLTYGLLHERQGKSKDAQESFEAAVKLEPSNAISLAHLADAMRMNGDLDGALVAAQAAVRCDPDSAFSYIALGSVQQARSNATEAGAAFEKALSLKPDTVDVNVYVRLAALALSQRPPKPELLERAGEWLGKASAIEPGNPLILRLLAASYAARGKLPDAVRIYADAEKAAPGNPGETRDYADALIGAGRYDDAQTLLNAHAKQGAGDLLYWEMYYKLAKARGRAGGAIPFFKQQLDNQPGNTALLLALGDTLMDQKQFKEAAAVLKQASELKKDDPLILADYGQVLANLGDPAGAVPAKRAYELNPDDPQTMLAVGNTFLRLGKSQDAEPILVKLVGLVPGSKVAWELMLACYDKQGKTVDVDRCRKKLADLGVTVNKVELQSPTGDSAPPPLPSLKIPPPEESMAAYKKLLAAPQAGEQEWLAAGMDLFNNKQYSEAEAAFRKITEIDPQKSSGWTLLGFSLWGQKKTDEALPMFQKALEKDQRDAKALQGVAMCQNLLNHYPEAGDAAAKYTELDPNNKTVCDILIHSLLVQKKWDEADARASKALESHPDWATLWMGDGFALKNMKQPDKALAAFQKATEVEPQNSKTWIQLGQMYGEMGQIDKSIAMLQRATELAPGDAEGWNSLGYSTFLNGDTKTAAALYQKSIDCDGKFEMAWANLAHLYAKQGDTAKTAETCGRIEQFDPALARQLRAELDVK